MKNSRFKSWVVPALVTLLCLALLTACGAKKLSADFDEGEVKKAAENVIALINAQDSDELRELCTVQLKKALTDDVMKQVFAAIGEGGEFTEIEKMSIAGTVDKSSKEEFAVVVAKAKYKLKAFTFTISFTKQMKLAGLYYK